MKPGPKQLRLSGISREYAQNYYTGFPVFLVAFTLIWAGVLGLAQYVWVRGSGLNHLIAFDPAFAFLLCGAALVFARSNVRVARVLAFTSFLASVACAVNGTSTQATFESIRPFDLPLQLELSQAIIMWLLSLCIVCCTFGSRLQRLARWVAVASIIVATIIHFAPDWFPIRLNFSDTNNFATALLVLTACSVVALSKRHKPVFAFFNKNLAIIGTLGALVSVLAWYALTAYDRHSVQDHAQKSTVYIGQVLSHTIDGQLNAMRNLASHWESLEAIASTMLRQQELSGYLHNVEALDLIAVTDSRQQIQLYEDRDWSNQQWLEEHKTDDDYLAIITQAHQNATARIGTVDGRTIIAAPLSTAALDGWTIVAVYDSAKFIVQSFARNLDSIKIRISQNHQLIFDEVDTSAPIAFISQNTVPMFKNYAWEVSAWYQYRTIPPIVSLFPDLVFFLCFIFTYLLTRSQKIATMLLVRSNELQYAAMHDSLTGLPNAKYLNTALKAACHRAIKKKTTISVVLVNLSGIKLINASIGEGAGDEVVREAARRIFDEIGREGLVTRLIGDNFVVVITDRATEYIRQLAVRIINGIDKSYHFDGGDRNLTSNVGLTVSDGNVEDPMELVRQAKLALTQAKLEGRNVWHEYSTDLSDAIIERLELRNRLRTAMGSDVLDVAYQPLIDGQSGRIVAAEALLRWNDPEQGYISPAIFVPLAETMEMIVPLTDWVLTRVCRDIQSLRARNILDFPIQINISSLDFGRDDFIHSMRSKLAEYSLPGEVLAIEITEGMLLNNVSDAINKLQELKALGIKASIDDFGTGYSSLSYLKDLPIDKIKIDKSFISDVVTNQHDAMLVKAIIGLAHNLNLRVVAEGVETEPQYWFLSRNFCDEFQGYFFARPMPRDDLERQLMERGNRQLLPQAHSAAGAARTLLLLDDEENILRALKRLLRREGYNILLARTPREAFTLLAENNVHVIVSDQRMPEMSGTEFFSAVKQMYPNTVRLVLSGYTDLKSVTDAINHGAIYKFLTKPWDDEELRVEIAQAFRVSPAFSENNVVENL